MRSDVLNVESLVVLFIANPFEYANWVDLLLVLQFHFFNRWGF